MLAGNLNYAPALVMSIACIASSFLFNFTLSLAILHIYDNEVCFVKQFLAIILALYA